jgi:hypothetical protein
VLSLQWANIRTSPVGIPYIFFSFYSNDFEFFPVALGQELVLVSFQGFSYGSFSYTVKKMEFRWRKSRKRNERDIERALGSRGTFLSGAGVGTQLKSIF